MAGAPGRALRGAARAEAPLTPIRPRLTIYILADSEVAHPLVVARPRNAALAVRPSLRLLKGRPHRSQRLLAS